MKKKRYSTVIELYDKYEFCPPNENTVRYGTIIAINYDTKSFDFECSDAKVYNNITGRYIRGIIRVDDETWVREIHRSEKANEEVVN